MATTFIDCTSLNISYNVMGLATVNFTVVSDEPGFNIRTSVNAAGRTFSGYVTSAYARRIPNTNWYETNVTLIATS